MSSLFRWNTSSVIPRNPPKCSAECVLDEFS
jgi:hypothetical protein